MEVSEEKFPLGTTSLLTRTSPVLFVLVLLFFALLFKGSASFFLLAKFDFPSFASDGSLFLYFTLLFPLGTSSDWFCASI